MAQPSKQQLATTTIVLTAESAVEPAPAQPSWQEIAQRKRDSLFAALPEQWRLETVPSPEEAPDATALPRQFLSEEEIRITESSAEQLLSQLAAGELTAVEVTKAFCHRATIAHQLTNCLSEVFFDQALADAADLDAFFVREGRVKGPLHGLPVSLKDQFRVRGVETSLGYVSWLGRKETYESESWLVTQLRGLGAVLYVKTSVPPSLMAIETNNNIIGYTTNATNRLLSSGGSSGGEAALLAMKGSPLGLGSDVGASIRLPCGLNGLVGLKPSHGRIPYLGVANSMEGHITIRSTIGPMSHSVPSLRLLTKSILATQPWLADPSVQRLPWAESIELRTLHAIAHRKLTFGILRHDGTITPHPPASRVLNAAATKLRAAGYNVVEWAPPAGLHAEGFGCVWDTFIADAGKDIHAQLAASGEPPVPELASAYGDKLGHLPDKSVNDLWSTQRRLDAFKAKYLEFWNNSKGPKVDAVILPVTPVTGFRVGQAQGIYPAYTAVFNALDYSVVAVRGGRADAAVDVPRGKEWEPLGEFDKMLQAQYDPALFDKAPIGLQVVCQRLEEEKALTIAEEVERVIGSA